MPTESGIPQVTATWHIKLLYECPHCEEIVDIMDDWECYIVQELEFGEHDTDESRNIEYECPMCGEKVLLTLEF